MEITELTLTMTVGEWNVVLSALSQRPYKEVATTIDKIRHAWDETVKSAPSAAAPRAEPDPTPESA